jgi:hypothetical protein
LIPNELFGLPTQERRDAWDWLWKSECLTTPHAVLLGSLLTHRASTCAAGRFSFPYEKLPLINKSTETRERWALPFPRGNEVIVMSEVMHQVHCVGVLWFFAQPDDWDYRTLLNKTELFMQIHQRHCQNILMLSTERDFRHLPIVHEGFVFLHLS